MEQITVVIGDRLGKGQKVAAGAEKAGARAVVVPGVAADMKLGDMMKAENATFGISFCGSGGDRGHHRPDQIRLQSEIWHAFGGRGCHCHQRRVQRAGLRLYG